MVSFFFFFTKAKLLMFELHVVKLLMMHTNFLFFNGYLFQLK